MTAIWSQGSVVIVVNLGKIALKTLALNGKFTVTTCFWKKFPTLQVSLIQLAFLSRFLPSVYSFFCHGYQKPL